MPTISLIGINPSLANVIQDGTIERMVHDALVSETLFRADVEPEVWTPNQGETINMTRDGLLPVSITPLTPGTDPTPQSFSRETWQATLNSYGSTVDHYLPDDYVANVPEFLRKMQKVGVNAGETLDRIIRARMFRAYLAGNTVTTALAAAGAATIHVASGNGFRQLNDANGLPVTVSTTNPLTITFGGTEPANTVTAITPDDPLDTDCTGPCTLTLGAVLTLGVAAREAVLAANRSRMVIAGGGNSVDALGAADTLSFADLVNAVTMLRTSPTVPGRDGGLYHCHMSPYAEGQLLRDSEVRGLVQAPVIPSQYTQYEIGLLAGARLFRNARCPDVNNVGTTVSTGAGSSLGAREIGGEVRNNAGLAIGYTIVTGQGVLYEKYVPPMATQAQLPAGAEMSQQRTAIDAQSGGVRLNTDRCKIIIRPPLDRNNEMMALTWNFKGDFPVPSDITSGDARFRRAVVIAHVIPA